MQVKAQFVNPFTDFGFKKLFGEEASKPALIDFLNSLLADETGSAGIVDVSFQNSERNGDIALQRKAVYDIYCENDKGEKYIVELQKARQDFFKERTIFYSTFPIREQAEQGSDWKFELKAVYCVGILGFTFRDYGANTEEQKKVVHRIKLKDEECRVFYDKLTYIYIEMPNFNKTEAELVSRLDQWLYFIKNLEDFQSIPEIFSNDGIFIRVMERARIAKYDREQQQEYESSLKVYRDLRNVVDSAERKGRKEGKEEGRLEGKEEGRLEGEANKERYAAERERQKLVDIAIKCKARGMPVEDIADLTGLSIDEINGL